MIGGSCDSQLTLVLVTPVRRLICSCMTVVCSIECPIPFALNTNSWHIILDIGHYYCQDDLLFKCLVQQLLNLPKVLLEIYTKVQQLLFHDHVVHVASVL